MAHRAERVRPSPSRPVPALPAALAGLALLAGGCGLLPGSGGGGAGGADPSASPSGGAGEGGFVREGNTGSWGDHLNARVEVTEVARVGGLTRLTAEYTNLEDRSIETGAALNPMNPRWFRIIDPVGQRHYAPFEDIGADTSDFRRDELWNPGVTYELVVFLPELEGDPEQVTVEGPGGVGEFAGVPVVDGEDRDYPAALPGDRADGWPAEGERVTVPVAEGAPEEDPGELVRTIVSSTESVVAGRETRGDRETVALRTDVLFGFDEAELDGDARAALEDVIAETKERADPEKPPITVTGHTDGIGTDRYNQELSEKRAEAVREVLEEGLGSGYAFETEGRGSSEPVEPEGGDDDSWARSQNRRVEISYAFKEETAVSQEGRERTERELFEVDPADAGAPAAFRPLEGEEPAATAVFEQSYSSNGDRRHEWTFEAYPFYRDGAFLVARFTATHEGDELPDARHPFGGSGHLALSAVDPATGTVYPQAYSVPEGRDPDKPSPLSRVGASGWPATAPGSTHYGYLYLAAPPEGTSELTLSVDGHALLEGVPIAG
ncbi:OmpA family protein [Nocardiopsis potens]|uniref:OmpA family protein n=1 Tax=Nocardiopsis potens TaxID=1246458 RepID=UPI000348ED89|nr:OmpA family protein [Nocardiopsis potens]